MSHILDDFTFISSSKSLCNLYLQQFFSLADSLSIPVKQSKTVMSSTCVIVHDIEVDTLQMVTLKELQSLIGTLNFACKVVVPGHLFLRHLIDLTMGIAKPHFHIRLGQEARLDLAAWLMFFREF